MNAKITLVIVIMLAISALSGVAMTGLAYADHSETNTGQGLEQENVGSGESTNNNCGQNLIQGGGNLGCTQGDKTCEECFQDFGIQFFFFDEQTQTTIEACEAVELGIISGSELRNAIETFRDERGDAIIDALIQCLTEAGIL